MKERLCLLLGFQVLVTLQAKRELPVILNLTPCTDQFIMNICSAWSNEACLYVCRISGVYSPYRAGSTYLHILLLPI